MSPLDALPAVCRSFVDVSAGLEAARVGTVRSGVDYEGVRVEGVSGEYMQMLAKRLAEQGVRRRRSGRPGCHLGHRAAVAVRSWCVGVDHGTHGASPPEAP